MRVVVVSRDGVDKTDLLDSSAHIANLDKVSHCERLGGEDAHAAGHIGEGILDSE